MAKIKKLLDKANFFFIKRRKYKIIYSLDGAYYYLNYYKKRKAPRCWLSTSKLKIYNREVIEQELNKKWFSSGLEIVKNNGEHYYREILDFSFWSVKSGERGLIKGTDDLVLDYLSIY